MRSNGLAGASVAGVMGGSGLTHGPFYNHFKSKQDMLEKSFSFASATSLEEMSAAILASDLGTFVGGYLSEAHRDAPQSGCLMAALATDVGRTNATNPLRAAFATHLEAIVEQFQRADPTMGQAGDSGRQAALDLVVKMVGAMVLARAVGDQPLSKELLSTVGAQQ
ncbi:TetR/AcrR family transcriptional regulator [Roseateles noduli]|uniref:TetR/AcrR family transcriptional regulator n=1 Tax=Roseateles noduli TaxID=2052484 RepID=UPI003D655775